METHDSAEELANLIATSRWSPVADYLKSAAYPTTALNYEQVTLAVGNREAFVRVVNRLHEIEMELRLAARQRNHIAFLERTIEALTAVPPSDEGVKP